MKWPDLSQYNAVVQNPHLCFEDLDLKASQIELNNFALPFSLAGQFGVVYKLEQKLKKRNWAVKCFLKGGADQHKRYQEISEYITALKSSYFVDFVYVERGIKVGSDNWFPVLKMRWQDGQLLHAYIEANLQDAAKLNELGRKFVSLSKALKKSGIAHGDLQNGNIVVINEKLKLVDYDGMFVPALSGHKAQENGHKNFQHPRRAELQPYDDRMDCFSSWSILTSLAALSLNPQLWKSYSGGYDQLLFTQTDYVNPSQSAIFKELKSPKYDEIRSLIEKFEGYCSCPLDSVPFLGNIKMPLVKNPPAAVPPDGDKPNAPSLISGLNLTPAPSPTSDANPSSNTIPTPKPSPKLDLLPIFACVLAIWLVLFRGYVVLMQPLQPYAKSLFSTEVYEQLYPSDTPKLDKNINLNPTLSVTYSNSSTLGTTTGISSDGTLPGLTTPSPITSPIIDGSLFQAPNTLPSNSPNSPLIAPSWAQAFVHQDVQSKIAKWSVIDTSTVDEKTVAVQGYDADNRLINCIVFDGDYNSQRFKAQDIVTYNDGGTKVDVNHYSFQDQALVFADRHNITPGIGDVLAQQTSYYFHRSGPNLLLDRALGWSFPFTSVANDLQFHRDQSGNLQYVTRQPGGQQMNLGANKTFLASMFSLWRIFGQYN